MSEMVERVAKVIRELEHCVDECNHCKRIAIKAIEAMREPTEKMHAAGYTAYHNADEEHKYDASWHAMIDAALK